jgi:hypothetical protein
MNELLLDLITGEKMSREKVINFLYSLHFVIEIAKSVEKMHDVEMGMEYVLTYH